MYVNLKPNQHKRISLNSTTKASLGFIDHPPKILGSPLNFTPPPKIKFFASGESSLYQLMSTIRIYNRLLHSCVFNPHLS